MKILIFSWRDIKNPDAGGAEVFTHENAKRFVEKGNEVTLFTSRFEGCKSNEIIDGVEVFRDGGKYTVYLKARKYYKERFMGKYDVVIDQINTVPFFTPWYVKEPIVVLIHQLAREFWFYETKFPISLLGYLLEPVHLRVYKNRPTITVSNSTKEDLMDLGFSDTYIISEGVNFKPLEKISGKEEDPTLIFVGRLKRAKMPDHAIKAFRIVKKKLPNAKLWIVGDGYFRGKLEKLNTGDDTKFFGYIPEYEKLELMRRAHCILVPGIREGWGLIVTEANAMGTPAIAYNVNGLRDSVRNGETGLLVESGNIDAFAGAIVKILKDDMLREELTNNALKWSKGFTWERSAEEFLKVFEGVVDKR
ncbi:MAG: glycosyltransferase family 4 protein [Halobacteriota archaeon]|nr:glycosyltransferase family 4 protein [Halobacteriota archaeon]MDY6931242.1 glycosyltransferase family 4 protein [Halobacteriota archaeon]